MLPYSRLEIPKVMTLARARALAKRYDIPAEIAIVKTEISALQSQLRSKREELHKALTNKAHALQPGYEFYGARPLDAIRELLVQMAGV